jgi:hypothetical protein
VQAQRVRAHGGCRAASPPPFAYRPG